MSISFTNYIDITSGVTGNGAVRARQLITRIFSQNLLIPANSFAEFTNSNDVGAYFGTTSTEYAYAADYFSFISKTATAPQLLSFASYVPVNRQPAIFGDAAQTSTLNALKLITTGAMALTLGATTFALSGVNLSAATSMANAAALVQAAIRAAVPSDPVWASAVVTFAANKGQFQLVGGGTAGTGAVAVSPPATGADLGAALGWESVLTILSQGSTAMSLTATLIASVGASSNFATFVFLPDALTQAQNLEIATWIATQNNLYMFLCPVSATNAGANAAALAGFAGCAMVLSPLNTEFPELFPGKILAATDYSSPNASQNYMYQIANYTPSVMDDADQTAYDAIRVNYYGQTQNAGQKISFFQRGVLTGPPSAPSDMNVYANEIWFKSAIGEAWMSCLLALNEIPANTAGRAIGLSILQPVIDLALFNGTISVGNPVSSAQKLAIASVTGDRNAYAQVQAIGYWVNLAFVSVVTQDGRTEWQANYEIVYTKNNAIRKVNGTNNLI